MAECEDGCGPRHSEDAGAEEEERVPAEREECLRHHRIAVVVVDCEQCLLGESLDQDSRDKGESAGPEHRYEPHSFNVDPAEVVAEIAEEHQEDRREFFRADLRALR